MLAHWLDGGEVPVRHPVGRINDTWMVAESHVLQRLNRAVFTRPEAVMRNLSRVLSHDDTLLLAPVPTRSGAPFVIDAQGDLWRLFRDNWRGTSSACHVRCLPPLLRLTATFSHVSRSFLIRSSRSSMAFTTLSVTWRRSTERR